MVINFCDLSRTTVLEATFSTAENPGDNRKTEIIWLTSDHRPIPHLCFGTIQYRQDTVPLFWHYTVQTRYSTFVLALYSTDKNVLLSSVLSYIVQVNIELACPLAAYPHRFRTQQHLSRVEIIHLHVDIQAGKSYEIFINYTQGRRENSRGPGQNFIRGPYDVIIFKQQD